MTLDIICGDDIVNKLSAFKRNFNALFPLSPQLLIIARNEKDEQKSVMSFLSPSLIPYQNFVDLRATVVTISTLLQISPSDDNILPTLLQPPSKIMALQNSSVVEAAFTLASVLMGCGYSVFIVQGEAVRDKVNNDFSMKSCPYQLPTDLVKIPEEEKKFNKYRVKAPTKLESTFKKVSKHQMNDLKQQNKDYVVTRGRILATEEDKNKFKTASPYFWVLILPSKEHGLSSSCFANVADGTVCDVKNCSLVFKKIHSVFNSENFWACKYFQGDINEISFDLTDTKFWYPLFDESLEKNCIVSDRWTEPLVISEKVIQLQYPFGKRREVYRDAVAEKFAPFVNEKGVVLSVTRNKQELFDYYTEDDWSSFELLKHRQDCLVKRSINFKNEVYESFSKSRTDTLKGHRFKKKVSGYNDKEDVSKIETDLAQNFEEEYFEFYHQFRADSLKSRHLYLSSLDFSSKSVDVVLREPETRLKKRWKASLNILKKCTDEHSKSKDQLTEHTLIVDSMPEDKFKSPTAPEEGKKEEPEDRMIPPKISFDRSRADILEFIQKLGKEKSKRKKTKFKNCEERKAILEELYVNRTDFLRSRTVTFSSANDFFKEKKLSNDSIEEIREEFECPPSVPDPETFIQKRIFCSSRKECLLIYHYGKNRLLQSSHLFDIPRDNKISSLTPDMIKSFDPNHKSTPPSLEELRNLLSKQLEVKSRIDKEILSAVDEMKLIAQRRKDEEDDILLNSGFFQFNHNPLLAQLMEQEKKKESKKEEEEKKRREEKEGKVDTISPYFPLLYVDNLINVKELIKERCLEDQMKRLEIRANLLQDRLDKARAEIMFLREELGGRKRRPSPEERLILSEKLAKAEAEHRRLRGFLVNWRNEAAHKYELLEAALETNQTLNDDLE